MAEALLQARGLGHRFGSGRWLFRGLDLTLGQGDRLAVLGPNGRGKSTLLQLLSGARPPRAGTVACSGRLALVPQAFEPAFAFSALDLVLTGRSRRIGLLGQPSEGDEEAALTALGALGLAWAAARAFQTLSGGERRLVLLARALAAQADLLILDEPTAALDLRHQQQVLGWMHRLGSEQGRALVFTTHDPSHALRLATQALLLDEAGHQLGPPADVLTEDALSRLYGVPIRRAWPSGGRQGAPAFVALQEIDTNSR